MNDMNDMDNKQNAYNMVRKRSNSVDLGPKCDGLSVQSLDKDELSSQYSCFDSNNSYNLFDPTIKKELKLIEDINDRYIMGEDIACSTYGVVKMVTKVV